jgi:hypothetical protein
MHKIELSNDELTLLLIAVDDSLHYVKSGLNKDEQMYCEAASVVHSRDLSSLRAKLSSANNSEV